MKRTSTIHAFFETAARQSAAVAVRWRPSPGRWSALTWGEYAREVRRVARALAALGVRPGDRVALCGPNRPEWLLADLGALAAGAVPAPYYPTLNTDQAGYVVEHSEAVVAIVHDAAQLAKLDAMRSRLPRLRTCVVMEGAAAGALGWSEFLARATDVPESAIDERLERHLSELAKREGISLNRAALMLMKKGARLSDPTKCSSAIGNALDRFIGSWSEEEEREVLEGIDLFETVDESLWK